MRQFLCKPGSYVNPNNTTCQLSRLTSCRLCCRNTALKSGLQIGLWLNGNGSGCRDIVSGVLDDNIYRLFHFIGTVLPKSLPKVFLRVGYEFDNPSFGYSENPPLYREAFRKRKARIRPRQLSAQDIIHAS